MAEPVGAATNKARAVVRVMARIGIGYVALVIALIVAGVESHPAALAVQAATPAAILVGTVAALASLVVHDRHARIWALAVLACYVAIGLELRLATDVPRPTTRGFEIIGSNLEGDITAATELLADLDPTVPLVVVTVETPVEAVAAFSDRFGGPAARGAGLASGVYVWSTMPFEPLEPLVVPGRSLPRIAVRQAPDTPAITIVGVHLSSPTTAATLRAWRTEWDAFDPALHAITGPVVVLGDFNTSHAHHRLRGLLDRFESLAMASTFSGSAASWPTEPYAFWPFPVPLLDLDHILVSELAADGFDHISLVGTDHRATRARIGEPLQDS